MGYASGVGRQAPAFTLTAVDGNEIDLGRYRGEWFPILVFVPLGACDSIYRPSCYSDHATLLEGLSEAAGSLWGLRGQLLGICVGDSAATTALAGLVDDLAFPLLTDDGTVASAYGVDFRPAAGPTVFILDRAGKIVWQAEGESAVTQGELLAAFQTVVR
jgi:peroxiredoxin